jgi:hypothetical protein
MAERLRAFLRKHGLALGWWVLLGLLGVVMRWMAAATSGPRQLDVQLAGTPEQMAGVFSKLPADRFHSLRQVTTIDSWLLVPLYVGFLIISIVLVRRRFYVIPAARRVGGSLLVVAVMAGLFDLVENHLILHLIRDDSIAIAGAGAISASTVAAITGFSLAKYTGLVLVGLYVVPALIGYAWRTESMALAEEVVFTVLYAVLVPVFLALAIITRARMMDRDTFVRTLRIQDLTRPPGGEVIGEDAALLGAGQATLMSRLAPPEAGRERRGVCLSGGGIRSASFSLGALQALQRDGVLDEVDTLAAASGGGYLAGSYQMVRSHGVFASDPGTLPPPYAPGSPEETWLRKRSAYLAHTLGQKIRLVTRLAVGIGVNALFLFGLLYAVLRPIGWVLHDRMPTMVSAGTVTGLALPLAHGIAVAAPLAVALLAGLLTVTPRIVGEDRGQEHTLFLGRSLAWLAGAAFFAFVLLPASVWLLYKGVPTVWRELPLAFGKGKTDQETVNLVALFSAGGALAFVTTAVKKQLAGVTASVWAIVAAAVVMPLLVLWTLVSVVFGALEDGITGTMSPFGLLDVPERGAWLAVMALLALFWLISDQRAWSMHRFYKRRLHRAFGVQRTGPEEATEIPYGEPTDFQLGPQPQFVSCAVANLSDYAVVPPGLRAVSFTFDALQIGSPEPRIGHVAMPRYRDWLDRVRAHDVTVPAAVAISGAAVSPAMGKQTRPWLTAFMTLANVRLGVWLPNPRWMCAQEFDSGEVWWERPRVSYLLKEMLGMHSIDDRFLYVTDGGHYDNLGLVEALRRGCTTVYVFDASGGQPGTFGTIGEALALARSELGIEFDVPLHEIRPPDMDAADQYEEKRLKLPWRRRRAEVRGGVLVAQPYVWGTFTDPRLPGGTKGHICYVQAAVSEEAPWQVRSYWEVDERFPNHSTIDQDFDFAEFEAYRALGEWAAGEAIAATPSGRGS